jgi:hypothetical protein
VSTGRISDEKRITFLLCRVMQLARVADGV